MPRHIALLVFDGISDFHLAVPHTVFAEDRSHIGVPRYRVSVCAARRGPIRTAAGLELRGAHGLDALKHADTVIVPSWYDVERAAPAPVIEALRRAHRRGSRVVGLCMGAFPVAEAGLLDGRAGTTHWAWTETFARRFPAVRLDPKVLYIDHGDVVTSAGTAAGLDCCLHLLRQDVGAELANRVARRLVVPPHRQGSQAQFVEQPTLHNTGVDRMARTLEWAQAHLDQDCGIDVLARRAAMGRRTFTRHFHQATGMSVVQWLTAQRLSLAQRLLETTDAPIERVAQKAGFGSPLSLRLSFAKALDTTPSQYRREFSRRRAV